MSLVHEPNFYVNLKTLIYLNPCPKIALTDISYPNNVQKLPDSIFEEDHAVNGEIARININLNPSTGLNVGELINQMNEQRNIYHEAIAFDLVRKSDDHHYFQVKSIGYIGEGE